ncbi:MAG TPA: hypothetical protein VE869_04125 [Gemmatimonas sp.]|nr:hypothetical protein [Gemmatimonas sp.]
MIAVIPCSRRLLSAVSVAVVCSSVSAVLNAQSLQPAIRVVREASTDGGGRAVEGPNGRTIVIEQNKGLVLYDRVTKGTTPLAPAGDAAAWSPRGGSIVFSRQEERGSSAHIWMVPMDSARGTPTGAPRRISARTGTMPAVSPDGRSVAYVNNDSTGFRVLVAPITGGNERTILEDKVRLAAPQWAGDGVSLFVHRAGSSSQSLPSLLRVAAAGGTPSTVLSPYLLRRGVLTAVGANVTGSLVHEFAKGAEVGRDRTQMVLSDVSGRSLGSFLPAPSMRPSAWSMASPTRMLVNHWVGTTSIRMYNVADGSLRSLTDTISINRWPQFSPDGRQVAYQTLVGDRFQIAVVPATGGARRVFATSADPRNMRWSPDGSAIAFMADQEPTLHVLDTRNGALRRLIGEVDRSDSPRWRADGKAIRYVRRVQSAGSLTLQVRQVLLDGRDELLRSFGPVAPVGNLFAVAVRILNDTMVAVRTPGEMAVADLRSDAQRTIFRGDVSMNGGTAFIDGSPDGRWLAASIDNVGGGERVVLVATDGSGVRQTGSAMACGSIAHWGPKSDVLVLLGYPTCDGGYTRGKLYLLPTDGSEARLITAKDNGYDFMSPDFSPDGRSLVYAADAPWQARLLELDFAGALRASGTSNKAPSRR